ncbi:MAG: FGGY family carbohydrate kinase [Kiritimatiellaeota bacterium]|nr:FGGY family carbohydrate kinase [Kiritimatiellota bacterium]
MERCFLAVDIGASGGKCFAGYFGGDAGFRMEEVWRFDHEAARFFAADRNGDVSQRLHWDDTFIYHQIIKGLQHFRRNLGTRLDGIGIDTWGSDAALLTADGEMLAKVYAYRDTRLDCMVDEVKALISAERIYGITGIHFQPFNMSNQLRWWCTRRPGLMREADVAMPVPSLFYWFLGGCRMVDSTWASVTQLMDARTLQWSAEIFNALGIPENIFPAIVAPGARVGTLWPRLAQMIGLEGETPLYATGSHDTANAYAAAPVKDPRKALIISSGTWSLVGKLVAEPLTTPAAMAMNFSNEGGIGDTRLLKNCMGTWIIQELLRIWEARDGKRMAWAEVDAVTPAAPAFSAFINPDDPRFYNPPDMEAAIMGFLSETGQTLPKDRGTILRVVYESLAMQYRNTDEKLRGLTGDTTDVCHIVGGGSGNALLNQFTASALGFRVLAGPKEATAAGNLMLQAVGSGACQTLADAQRLCAAAMQPREFLPADIPAWSAAYATYKEKTHA